ncbi:hypothetical protein GCM10009099_40500 [Caenispirillum bisanense]
MHHPDFLATVDDAAREMDDGTEITFYGDYGPVRMGSAEAGVLRCLGRANTARWDERCRYAFFPKED